MKPVGAPTSIEDKIERIFDELRDLGGEVAELKGAIVRIESNSNRTQALTVETAARVQRLDSWRELTLYQIHQLNTAMAKNSGHHRAVVERIAKNEALVGELQKRDAELEEDVEAVERTRASIVDPQVAKTTTRAPIVAALITGAATVLAGAVTLVVWWLSRR